MAQNMTSFSLTSFASLLCTLGVLALHLHRESHASAEVPIKGWTWRNLSKLPSFTTQWLHRYQRCHDKIDVDLFLPDSGRDYEQNPWKLG
jgi:hypothetical protein